MPEQSNSIGKKSNAKKSDYSHLSFQLKKQMDDIIDVAFKDKAEDLPKLKKFHIECKMTEMKSRLGDCRTNRKTGFSEIRIVRLGQEEWREVLITTMHEVSHHIDHCFRKTTGHDNEFYDIHKKLLFAAFDMGILARKDVINSTSDARNRDKLAKMMVDYVPNPVPYKQDKATIHAYNCFNVKDDLKAKGYKWNNVDKSWVLETEKGRVEEERAALLELGLSEADIRIIEGGAVVSRLRKNVRLYDVPYESRDIPKRLGFRWDAEGKYWEKKITGNKLPPEEWEELKKMKVMKIKIT